MGQSGRAINLRRYWPFWGLHFAIHIIIGLVASIAGLVVIFQVGEILNGLALIGAGSFALVNGWQGYRVLVKNKSHRRSVNK